MIEFLPSCARWHPGEPSELAMSHSIQEDGKPRSQRRCKACEKKRYAASDRGKKAFVRALARGHKIRQQVEDFGTDLYCDIRSNPQPYGVLPACSWAPPG